MADCTFAAYCHQPEKCIPARRCMGGFSDNEVASATEAGQIAHNMLRIKCEEGRGTEEEAARWLNEEITVCLWDMLATEKPVILRAVVKAVEGALNRIAVTVKFPNNITYLPVTLAVTDDTPKSFNSVAAFIDNLYRMDNLYDSYLTESDETPTDVTVSTFTITGD